MDSTPKMCPKCGSRRFYVGAHVTQEWKVNEHGDFLECTEDCVQVTHYPNDSDLWQCANCDYEAEGRKFNGVCKYEVIYDDTIGYGFFTPEEVERINEDLAGELNCQCVVTLENGEQIETGIIDSITLVTPEKEG